MKTKIFIFATAVFILVAFVFSCKTTATAPEEETIELAVGLTFEKEYFFGRAVGANILSSYRLWNSDLQLLNYLNLICNAIVVNSPNPYIFNGYRVAILDSNEINSFSTSGGHIFLTRGLVNAIRSEDSLAAVLAHEIAHIQLKHNITNALLEVDASDADQFAAIFYESVEEIAAVLKTNGYSHEQEFEADNLALNLMALAGYNPKAYLDMLRDLSAAQSRSRGGFNTTHPSPAQRAENAQAVIEKHDIPDTRVHRQIRFISAGLR
jgi:predicted Zn-dependent protease